MPADKITVEVKVKAKSDFASDAISIIEKTVGSAIKGSGSLTTDNAKDKKAPRWMMTSEFSGALDKDGKKFAGKLSTSLLVMNATASGANLSGSGATELARPGKLGKDDVTALAESLAEGMAKKAVAHMKTLKV
ncbi:MAG: hypothetical protein KF788_02995 [Piscinibacter sp.]|nr:hypothetical protein [Piscinibacter sp.]